MTTAEKIAHASRLGKLAFEAQRTSVPFLDKDLMAFTKEAKLPSVFPLLEAWTKAWHKANLS